MMFETYMIEELGKIVSSRKWLGEIPLRLKEKVSVGPIRKGGTKNVFF